MISLYWIPQVALPLGKYRKSSLANPGFRVSCSEDWCSSKSSDMRRMRRDSFWMFGLLVSKSNDMLRTTLVVTDSSRCQWAEQRSQRDLSCGVTRWQIALTCPGLPPICRSTGCFANFCRIPSVLVKLPWLCAPWSRSHGRSGRWIRFRKSSADLGARMGDLLGRQDSRVHAWGSLVCSGFYMLLQTHQNMAKHPSLA